MYTVELMRCQKFLNQEENHHSKGNQLKRHHKLSKNEKQSSTKSKKNSYFKSNQKTTDWNKENKIDYCNYDKINKFSYAEEKLFNDNSPKFKTQQEVPNWNAEKNLKNLKKNSFDRTEDSSNKASNSSSDEREFQTNESQEQKNIQKSLISPHYLNQLQEEPFNKYNKRQEHKIPKYSGNYNPRKENTEILNISIKVSQNNTLIFKLRRYDDLIKTVQLFCDINHINSLLVKPIVIKVMKALNQIYSAYNSSLSLRDMQLLKQIKENDF